MAENATIITLWLGAPVVNAVGRMARCPSCVNRPRS
jgi:hypothetical protein